MSVHQSKDLKEMRKIRGVSRDLAVVIIFNLETAVAIMICAGGG